MLLSSEMADVFEAPGTRFWPWIWRLRSYFVGFALGRQQVFSRTSPKRFSSIISWSPEAIVTKISGLIELAIALLLHPILAQSDIGVKSYLRKTDLGLLGLFHRFLWIGKVANMCPNVKFNSESIAGEILKIASAVLQIFALLPSTTFQIPWN